MGLGVRIDELTPSNQAVLDFIRGYVAEHGYSPSVREIGAARGHGTNAVAGQLQALVRKGYLKIDPKRARSIRLIERPVEADGRCPTCGQPIVSPVPEAQP